MQISTDELLSDAGRSASSRDRQAGACHALGPGLRSAARPKSTGWPPELLEHQDLQSHGATVRPRNGPTVFAGLFIEANRDAVRTGEDSDSGKDEVTKSVRQI